MGFAGLFNGNVRVNGTLFKSAGAFTIDHPLDPAHKYLQHSFVESPDMKDVYDGATTTNRKGFATVRLPAYFQALNRTFRYHLTIVGTRGWNARVVKEIAHNRFRIHRRAQGEGQLQVTGIGMTRMRTRTGSRSCRRSRSRSKAATCSRSCTGSQARRACSECPRASALGR